MTASINRTQFLRGDFSGRGQPCRPPWSPAEAVFADRCERCGDCARACPEGILRDGRGGYPEVDFARGGCTFCGDCLTACGGRVLFGLAQKPDGAWYHKAIVEGGCLSIRGVVCRSCGEACDTSAIRFKLELGGIARPVLNRDGCTGCGACLSVCPVQAIRLGPSAALRHAV